MTTTAYDKYVQELDDVVTSVTTWEELERALNLLTEAYDLIRAAIPAVEAVENAREAAIFARMEAGDAGAPDSFYDEYFYRTPFGRALVMLHRIDNACDI
jgi:ABC-type glycerol-3-phosphate transport system substrate-binding protein